MLAASKAIAVIYLLFAATLLQGFGLDPKRRLGCSGVLCYVILYFLHSTDFFRFLGKTVSRPEGLVDDLRFFKNSLRNIVGLSLMLNQARALFCKANSPSC